MSGELRIGAADLAAVRSAIGAYTLAVRDLLDCTRRHAPRDSDDLAVVAELAQRTARLRAVLRRAGITPPGVL